MLPLERRFNHMGQSIAWGSIGGGDPIVLIHGFPWSAQAWRHIAPWLAEHYTVYYFDMLGCGQSHQAQEQNVSPAVQNELLTALFSYWSLDRPAVVVHDFGGLAALRGYFLNGLKYSRLTLIDAVAVLPSGSPLFAHVRQHEAAFAGLPTYAHEALFRAYINRAALHPMRGAAEEAYLAPWRGDDGQAAFYRQIAHAEAEYIEEVQALYKPMDCRIDLLWGEQDSFIPPAQGKQLAEMLSADTLTIVPDAAHAIQEDAPEAIVAALLRQ